MIDFGADAEGRLSGVTRTAAGETAAFAYDALDRLLTISQPWAAGGLATKSV